MSSAPHRWRAWVLWTPVVIFVALWWIWPFLRLLWSAAPDLTGAVDSSARLALRNTVVWVVVAAVGSTAAGLALAWLAERSRASRLLVPLVLVPTVTAGVVVAVAWRSMLAFRPAGTSQVGLLNQVLVTPGLDPVAWVAQPPLNTLLLAGALVWMQTGVAMVLLLVAMARVPNAARDAAALDGATDLQTFRYVTVPSIRGAIALAAVSSAAVAVKVFDLVVVGTDGLHSTAVLGTESVNRAVRAGGVGSGAAVAVVMLVLLAPLAAWAVARSRRTLAARVGP